MSTPPSAENARKDLRNYLKFLRNAGFLYLVPSGGEPRESAHSRAERLESLRASAVQCTKCKLSGGRTHVVFGEGAPDADLMFIGEAPGRDEDLQARPFVGRAGQLLERMIVEVGLERRSVFICNILKCRPPGNRDPEPDEIDACEPYLLAQIDLIQPKVIVALGRFAAHWLSGTTTPITRMRGNLFLYHDVKVMPTLHPAAVLRNMGYHANAIADLRRAVQIIAETP